MCQKNSACAQNAVTLTWATAQQSGVIIFAILAVGMLKGKFKRRRLQEADKSDQNSELSEQGCLSLPRRKASHSQMRDRSSEASIRVKNMNAPADARSVASNGVQHSPGLTDYEERRRELLLIEHQSTWDSHARERASPAEKKARRIIFKIREHERTDPKLYGNLPSESIPDPQTRDMGGRFLVNKPTIERSKVFQIAQQMPKGAHLHIHFNSEIPPDQLFPHARSPEMAGTMYVRTSQPLCNAAGYDEAEVVFNVLPADTRKADCFSPGYNPDFKDSTNSPWMLWADFRKRFPSGITVEERQDELDDAENWARQKMIITVEHAYHDRQTHNGAWACFNQGTRAFKGLLNYEGVYRWYIGNAIDSMIRDNVMYAELRPMLLDKTIPSNDGLRQLDHKEQMNVVCEEVAKKHAQLKKEGRLDKFPFQLKIIYCTPRSIPRARMQTELQDCLKLKQQFPDLICGFDLVGAEDRPNNIRFYADLLLDFQKSCKSLDLRVPFMFHAGETLLDTGGSCNPDNSNLYDALLLDAKRIGHGYALLKHPLLVERYKRQNIALELCPISNELLHLCSNAREHPFPQLLAAGLHCTLNADNPSLYRGPATDSSSLSHEFYQVMVGDLRMNVHGWKQLAEWSIEHSCLNDSQRKHGMEIFARDWEVFCEWVVKEFGEYAATLPDVV